MGFSTLDGGQEGRHVHWMPPDDPWVNGCSQHADSCTYISQSAPLTNKAYVPRPHVCPEDILEVTFGQGTGTLCVLHARLLWLESETVMFLFSYAAGQPLSFAPSWHPTCWASCLSMRPPPAAWALPPVWV